MRSVMHDRHFFSVWTSADIWYWPRKKMPDAPTCDRVLPDYPLGVEMGITVIKHFIKRIANQSSVQFGNFFNSFGVALTFHLRSPIVWWGVFNRGWWNLQAWRSECSCTGTLNQGELRPHAVCGIKQISSTRTNALVCLRFGLCPFFYGSTVRGSLRSSLLVH